MSTARIFRTPAEIIRLAAMMDVRYPLLHGFSIDRLKHVARRMAAT